MESQKVIEFAEMLWRDVHKQYDLIGTHTLRIHVSYDRRRTRSWGGWTIEQVGDSIRSVPYILIAMNTVDKRHFAPKRVGHYEYEPIAKRKDIGNIVGSRERAWKAAVAHEIAHAASCFLKDPTLGVGEFEGFKDHPPSWHHIYRHLRTQYVNKPR